MPRQGDFEFFMASEREVYYDSDVNSNVSQPLHMQYFDSCEVKPCAVGFREILTESSQGNQIPAHRFRKILRRCKIQARDLLKHITTLLVH